MLKIYRSPSRTTSFANKALRGAMIGVLGFALLPCLGAEIGFAAAKKPKPAAPEQTQQPEPPEANSNKDNKQVCVKMCEKDQSPCDPLYFKQADGRCAMFWTD